MMKQKHLEERDASAYYNRGLLYSKLGEYDQAINSFRQAADLFKQQGNTEWHQKSLDKIRELQQ